MGEPQGKPEGLEGETVHFGTGRAVSVAEVAALCMKVTGRKAEIEEDAARVRPEGSEVELLLADSAKAASVLGWSPTVRLEDGLARVAEFVEANRQDYVPQRYAI